ncbi:DNA primase [Breznakia blatticola]|uniref:DNA primase n=1 Tax=Breznakia blatticola TaxID=1754012 RepID=A0A4R7Z8Q4_9FIRM|nr:DNA primase [Breznakia blatticola]TDW13096.1 DNA primase [Breznakia blatticola]
MIPQDKVQEILNKADIVDVISSYIPLTQKGKNFVCVCPFHDDSRPSMSVSQDKQIFKCFSCGAGGNAITFVQKYNNISFQEACKIVADKVGVNFEIRGPRQQTYSKDVVDQHALLKDVKEYAVNELAASTNEDLKSYVASRFDTESVKSFYIGYVGDSQALLRFLQAKGHSEEAIAQSNVFNVEGRSFLQDRIIFPLNDTKGNTVGFSARTYKVNDNIKYINSAESEVFKKGSILFNYDRAFQVARQSKEVIVVEGYMDAIKLAKVGHENVVALMGTAMAKDQVYALKRMNVPVNLCLDGDAPGKEAALKHYWTLKDAGLDVKMTALPLGMDPDELINKQPEVFEQELQRASNIIDFRLADVPTLEDFEIKHTWAINCLKDLKGLDNPLAEDHYFALIGDKVGFSKEALQRSYAQLQAVEKEATVKVQKQQSKNRITRWSPKQVKINLAVKDKMNYRQELQKNFDRLKGDEKVVAFNARQICDRKDVMSQYLDQKGKVLETTITLTTNDDVTCLAQGIAETAAMQISKELSIPKSNLEYIAFLHKDTKFPHIHLQCYQKETFKDNYELSTKLVESLQNEISKEITKTITQPQVVASVKI